MTIINNLQGGGLSTGKSDEYGLPIASIPKGDAAYGDHVSREAVLQAVTKVHHHNFVVSTGMYSDEQPEAYFYNPVLAPIENGWKRGLYTLEAGLGIEKLSVMVRTTRADVEVQFYIADAMTQANEIFRTPTIDASKGLGHNNVFVLPKEMILKERHALFVEFINAPDDWECCPVWISPHVVTNDYCHHDTISSDILQAGCTGAHEVM